MHHENTTSIVNLLRRFCHFYNLNKGKKQDLFFYPFLVDGCSRVTNISAEVPEATNVDEVD